MYISGSNITYAWYTTAHDVTEAPTGAADGVELVAENTAVIQKTIPETLSLIHI